MPNFHQTIVAGHVGRAAEIKGQGNVTSWSIAVTEKWKGRDGGQGGERTQWYQCTGFGERWSKIAQYICKGDPLMVIGKLRTEKYNDREGIEKERTQLIVDQVEFLRGRSDTQRQAPRQEQSPARGGGSYADDEYVDDGEPIPFAYWHPREQAL